MNRTREFLTESRDFWQKSADYDKRQLRLSVAIGGTGLALAGAGIIGIVAGIPIEGALATGVGGFLAYGGGQSAKSEIQSMVQMEVLAALREDELKRLESAED